MSPRVYPPLASFASKLVNARGKLHAAIYRASRGRLGARNPEGAPRLLLNHVGAKSGKARTSPRTDRQFPLMILEPQEDRSATA